MRQPSRWRNPIVRTRHWMPLVSASLIACAAVNPPGFQSLEGADALSDVTAIQSLIAEVIDPTKDGSGKTGSGPTTVLEVQRLLSGVSDPDPVDTAVDAPICWAVAPAPLRSDVPNMASPPRMAEVPRDANEGLRQQVQPFPPPPLSRVMDRYRMMFTPHAPPGRGQPPAFKSGL